MASPSGPVAAMELEKLVEIPILAVGFLDLVDAVAEDQESGTRIEIDNRALEGQIDVPSDRRPRRFETAQLDRGRIRSGEQQCGRMAAARVGQAAAVFEYTPYQIVKYRLSCCSILNVAFKRSSTCAGSRKSVLRKRLGAEHVQGRNR